MTRRIATESYPPRRKIREGFENKIKFDGGHQFEDGEDRLFVQKLGFDAELYTTTLPTLVRKIWKPLNDLATLDTSSIQPRAYRVTGIKRSVSSLVLLQSNDRSVCIMTYTLPAGTKSPRYINADGDEVWYVYQGSGRCITSFGLLHYKAGDYLYIPRLVPYCLHGDDRTILIGIESKEPLKRPCFVQSGSPYNSNDLIAPDPVEVDDEADSKDGFIVYLTQMGVCRPVIYAQSLFSCVGYDGDLYPFILHTKDIVSIIQPTIHTDPNLFTTFVTEDNGVAISTFTPRLVHSLPYNHMNHWDECLFLAKRYEARGGSIGPGDLTHHPQGFYHGPQFQAFLDWEKNKPKDIQSSPWNDDLAIMFETPLLIPTQDAHRLEIEGYSKSWIESWEAHQHPQKES